MPRQPSGRRQRSVRPPRRRARRRLWVGHVHERVHDRVGAPRREAAAVVAGRVGEVGGAAWRTVAGATVDGAAGAVASLPGWRRLCGRGLGPRRSSARRALRRSTGRLGHGRCSCSPLHHDTVPDVQLSQHADVVKAGVLQQALEPLVTERRLGQDEAELRPEEALDVGQLHFLAPLLGPGQELPQARSDDLPPGNAQRRRAGPAGHGQGARGTQHLDPCLRPVIGHGPARGAPAEDPPAAHCQRHHVVQLAQRQPPHARQAELRQRPRARVAAAGPGLAQARAVRCKVRRQAVPHLLRIRVALVRWVHERAGVSVGQGHGILPAAFGPDDEPQAALAQRAQLLGADEGRGGRAALCRGELADAPDKDAAVWLQPVSVEAARCGFHPILGQLHGRPLLPERAKAVFWAGQIDGGTWASELHA
mmetsp:Transcript_40564/g.107498  ORF Transcript_40564/g.107498 Transcript_40564/m.107498 type:complete len:422 (+) Transcript_40564:593-1858(+)